MRPICTNDTRYSQANTLGGLMLAAPDHSVVGAIDLDAATKFFSAFGLVAFHSEELSAEASSTLYGLNGARSQIVMRTPNAMPGIRIVETPHQSHKRGPLDTGGYSVDIYARDMSNAVKYAKSKGYMPLPVATWELEGKSVQECRVLGPEGLSVVLIDGAIKRASVLDTDPTRPFSEINAYVNLVPDANLDRDFWTKLGGLHELRNTPFDGTPMVGLMELPRTGLDMRFALYWAGPDSPNRAKVELVSCEISPKGASRADFPLASGFGPIAFKVDSPKAAEYAERMLDGLQQAQYCRAHLEGQQRYVVGAISPAGVAFELWCLEDSRL